MILLYGLRAPHHNICQSPYCICLYISTTAKSCLRTWTLSYLYPAKAILIPIHLHRPVPTHLLGWSPELWSPTLVCSAVYFSYFIYMSYVPYEPEALWEWSHYLIHLDISHCSFGIKQTFLVSSSFFTQFQDTPFDHRQCDLFCTMDEFQNEC